ncbi:uncharacterized protein DFL_008530 [Arthrobotrys flagrans]|uniref:CENP-C homolog n=1 Tax=Arthrobotrys flagrans TaxID=97331 RepID=A0A436ZP57_ARTFL|nr:hypothetical protein DFL_008530 [Arthrobotrys flagrans]
MAAIAGNKKRENIHTDIGFVGRKTGFMVQTDLVRDDNGMEDMSAFFSPTSNAGTLPNLANDDDDSMGGDFEEDHQNPESDIDVPSDPRAQNMSAHDGSATMEIEESTVRSVTEVLEARKGINTPARRKSMHSTHATPNLPLSSVTPQSNLSTPAIRRPKAKATSKAPSSQLSKPLEQDEETRGSFGSHKENVPNSFDSRQSDGAPVEAPAPRPIPLGARASGLRVASGRSSSMLVTKSLRVSRPAITPPPLSDDDDDDDELPKFNEEPTLDDTEMDAIPAPQPKSRTTQRPATEKEDSAEPNVPETSSRKAKPGRKGKASTSKTTDEVDVPTTSKPDKPATQKRGRKPKVAAITEDASEAEALQADEEGLDTLDAGITDMEPREAEENIAAEPSPPKKGKGGRKKKQAATDTEAETEPQPSTSNNVGQKKKGGRPKKTTEPEPEPEEEPAQEGEPEPELQPVAQKAKGRPKKSKKQDALVPDRDIEPQEEEPDEEPAEQSQPETPTKRGRKRKAETLIPDTEPDTQGSSTVAESSESKAAKKRKSSKQTAAKPVAEKSKASKPDTSGAAEGRRPARSRTAPLQFWKNEKRVYGVAERDESGRAVALIADVIRVEDEPVAQKKKARPSRPVAVSGAEKTTKRTTKKKKAKEARNVVEESSSESEDGESEDDWEQIGKLVGMVRQWAPNNEDEDREDDEIEDEIATSRHGIEFKPIFGSDYLFAKTLGKPFMGCGILELQTGASKKLKSSGKMQLVFFILKGKIEAEVNELGFRISHGGQFQVPRGNMYKISNPFKKTARIFFAQACIPDPEDGAE